MSKNQKSLLEPTPNNFRDNTPKKKDMTPISLEVYRQLLFDVVMEMTNCGQTMNEHAEKLLALVDAPVALRLGEYASVQSNSPKQLVSLAVTAENHALHIVIENEDATKTEVATIAFDKKRKAFCCRSTNAADEQNMVLTPTNATEHTLKTDAARIMLTCPNCGNSTFAYRACNWVVPMFECLACGEYNYPEDMRAEVV